MLNIVLPMAGRGSRFANEGYAQPKPLIPAHGIPMIRLVIENIRPRCKHRFIFICQHDHVKQFELRHHFGQWAPDCEIVTVDGITEGAACTVLTAQSYIDNSDPIMIANSDQYVDVSIDQYLDAMDCNALDGLIMTMKANDPKWSFVGMSESGYVERVVEKQVISDQATVGIYNFRRGSDFVRSAKTMIEKNIRVNNEFYVAPVYNEFIADGARIGIYDIGSEGAGMYGLGTPTDLRDFLERPVSRRATLGIK